MTKIIIGGDIVPTASNMEYFENGDVQALVGSELREKLAAGDLTLFNLEVPLTDLEQPIEKCGPNLIAPVAAIKGLAAISPHFFTLANNHIMDQGAQGLFSTMHVLNDAGVAYAGAGANLYDASAPYVYDQNEVKVGVYCCAEHEFSIASENTPGANPFDPLESPDHVNKLAQQCDYVIVRYHGGKEHYRYPSPCLQKVCRKLIDKGADLVVCQHSHCIGCEEQWNGGRIIYGQGNFIFDNSNSEFWKTALLIEVCLTRHGDKVQNSIWYVPLMKTGGTVRNAEGSAGDEILSAFHRRSEEILIPGTVEDKYSEFAKTMQDVYLRAFAGKLSRRLIYRAINKASGYRFSPWLLSKKYAKEDWIRLRNVIECEAHRELMLREIRRRGK